MIAERITYRDADQELVGLAFRPTGIPRAAVAVYPTIMNPTPAVEAKAVQLAEAGYLALVCDFYGAQPSDFAESQRWAQRLVADPTVHRSRLRAGTACLEELSDNLPKLAIGFCMGGQAVLELAREGAPLLAVVSFHGLLQTLRPAEPGVTRPRILVCHGDADVLVPRDHVLAFWAEMDRAKADWHFHSYSGVPHGFTDPNPPPLGGATAYNASADRQSWSAMHALFDEVLGG